MADLNPTPVCSPKAYCATSSRRDNAEYFYTDEDIKRTFAKELVGAGRYPKVLSGVMGDSFYMAKFNSIKEIDLSAEFIVPTINRLFGTAKISPEGRVTLIAFSSISLFCFKIAPSIYITGRLATRETIKTLSNELSTKLETCFG